MIILRPAKNLILLRCWANQRLLGWRLDVFLAGFNHYHGHIINTALHLSRTAGRPAHVAGGSVPVEQEVSMFFLMYIFLLGSSICGASPRNDFVRVQATVSRQTTCIANMSDNGRSACVCSGQYWADYWNPYWFFCRCTMLLIKWTFHCVAHQ